MRRHRVLLRLACWLPAGVMLLGARPACAQLKPADRAEVVARVVEELNARYVFPDVASAMNDHIRQRLNAGAYDALTDRAAFARTLTTDLRSISNDKHLAVAVRGQRSDGPTPSRPGGRVVSADVLPGNVAYIKLTLIQAPERGGEELKAAMQNVNGADALIIDLRDNPGGSPDGVSLLAGYLIPQRTLLARIYSRPTNDTTFMWTTEVPGPHFAGDVYILTNRVTFSAAEAVAYHLKHVGRAKVVGEASGGGAHRISGTDLPAGFAITVPFTRPINVVTGGDWEGTGVAPDIAAASEKALDAAHLAALRALPETDERRAAIQRLTAGG